MKKAFGILLRGVICFFALIGFSLTSLFIASYFHLTDVSGEVDASTHILHSLTRHLVHTTVSASPVLSDNTSITRENITHLQDLAQEQTQKYCKLKILSYVAPDNASKIYEAYNKTKSDTLLDNMLGAVMLHLQQDKGIIQAIDSCSTTSPIEKVSEQVALQTNVFPWYNDSDNWETLLVAILKDKDSINKAAKLGGIEPRMLVAPLFVEQWRAYTSERELFKTLLKPLQTLATSSSFSLGTMNIKEDVAIQIEANLKNSHSPYYLGPTYEHLLDYSGGDTHKQRFARLANYRDHYYSYLYAALYLSQIEKQWSTSGYPIDDRPEIVATLFNIGFSHSHPNATPAVGGSTIKIGDTAYTFGRLAYEFYYSGELMQEFPYRLK